MTDASRPAPPFMYRYVGARSHPGTGDTADGTLRVRADLRGPNGLFASPLAIFFHDLSGIAVVRYAPLVVPIQVNVRVRSSAGAAEELVGHCELTRRGRSIMASEARMYDPRHPGRVVAFVTATWFNTGSALDVPESRLVGPGTVEDDSESIELADSILDAIGAAPRADGRGLDLDEVAAPHRETAALGGPASGTLHAGALQILAEGAAFQVAGGSAGRSALAIEELSTQLLAPARVAPISAIGEVLAVTDDVVDCRIEVREEGGSGRLAAATIARFRVVG